MENKNHKGSSIEKDAFQLEFEDYGKELSASELCERLGIEIDEGGKVLCPLHSEDKPSAHVYDDHLFCFGCGTYISPIRLVMGTNDWSYHKSVRWLEKEFGLSQSSLNGDGERYFQALEEISAVYQQIFNDSQKNPEKGIAYLEGRGLRRKKVENLVGYLPHTYQPRDRKAAERAGLISRNGNFLLAGRAVVAIKRNGRVVSVYGRALEDDHLPKHIYPVSTEPRMPAALWNLDACWREEEIWLCESIIDALTLVVEGFRAVGLFGTQGLTDARLALLKKTKIKRVNLVFDSDSNEAGQKASLEAGERLFRAGLQVSIVRLPLKDGEKKTDVNSYVQRNGMEEFRKIPTRDYFECLLDLVPSNGSIQGRYQALKPILEVIKDQPQLTWDEYAKKVGERIPGFQKEKVLEELGSLTKGEKESGKKKFRPLFYSRLISNAEPVLFSNGAFYRYRGGVFRYWYQEEIERIVIEILGDDAQPHQVDSVKRMLKSENFQRPELVNRSGLLNVKNGVLNLDTGEFLEHSPDFLSTVQSNVIFDPKARWTKWKIVLDQVLPEKDKQLLLSEIFGYCLTTSIAYHVAFFLLGDGANGKSVILEVLETLVGSDNCSALTLTDLKERFRLAELDGKLVNIVSEVEAKSLVDDAKFKSLVAGDVQIGERKNQDPFKFRPFAKWVIACNGLPATRDRSYGFERRVLILPFEKIIPKEQRNPNLARELIEEELSGILNWALGGYRRLRENGGFTIPEASTRALAEYKEQIDPILIFIEEHLSLTDTGGTLLKEINEVYRRWCEINGYRPVSSGALRKAIERELQTKAKPTNRGKSLPVLLVSDG